MKNIVFVAICSFFFLQGVLVTILNLWVKKSVGKQVLHIKKLKNRITEQANMKRLKSV